MTMLNKKILFRKTMPLHMMFHRRTLHNILLKKTTLSLVLMALLSGVPYSAMAEKIEDELQLAPVSHASAETAARGQRRIKSGGSGDTVQ
nr:hypothetical protein KXZ65_20185 [Pectobacterium sp. PL152]